MTNNGVTTTLAPVTLAPGQSTLSAPITVPLTTTGATVTANVTAPTVPDSNLANNTDTETATPLVADPAVDVNPIPSGAPGTTVTTTVTLSNNGTNTVTFTPQIVVNGVTSTLAPVTLAPGASTTSAPISVPVTTTGATVTANVTAASLPDTNLANNTDTEINSPLFADPGVDVNPIPSGAPGTTVTTTVTLSNSGSATVTFTPQIVVNGVTTTLAPVTLAPGQSTLSAPITVPLTTTGATVTANVTAPTVPDSNLANNTDTETATPLVADPAVDVNPIPSGAPGTTVTTTVTLSNNGTNTVTFTPQIVVNGVTSTLAPVTLAPGASTTSAPISVPVTTTGATVTANVTAASLPDTNLANNTDTEINSPLFADPGVDVNPIPSGAPGTTVTTTVTLSNNGSATVTFTPQIVVNGVTTTLAPVTLAPGQSTLSAPITVPLTTTGATVTANVTAPTVPDSNLANNTDTETATPLVADPAVDVNPIPSGAPGTTVTTTVTLSNNGTNTVTFTPQIVVNGVTSTLAPVTLAPGASTTSAPISVPVTTTGATVTANVTAASLPDTNLANNTDTEINSPLFADPGVDVNPIPSGAPGTTVTTTVTLSNSGSATVTFTPQIVVNGVTTTLAPVTLAPGQSTLSAPITVPLTTTGATVTANVTAPTVPDSNLANNTDTETATPLVADPAVDVNPIPSGAPGTTVTTTVTLSNNGTNTVTFTPQIVVNGVTSTLAPVTLAPGASTTSAPISVPVTTTGATVTANVTAASLPDTNLANNTDTETAAVASPTASISGRVFFDKNRTRFFEPASDDGLAGYQVELLQVQGTGTVVVSTAVTTSTGGYVIGGQQPGTGYQLRFKDPSGNVILGTPFNQSAVTQANNTSTGTNQLFSPVLPGSTVPVAGVIQDITLYPGDNVIQQNLPLDPSGVVYDSVTRQPLGGATVRLVGPPGSGFNPATQLVGGSDVYVTDAATGLYQFLFVNNPPSGVYTLEVTPPANYAPPIALLGGVSTPAATLTVPAGDTNVQPQAEAPPVGTNGTPGTTYYLALNFNFASAGNVFNNHIPLDPLSSGALLVSKVGDRSVAELGDSVRYTIRLRNTTGQALNNVVIEDTLPAGFRYIPGTARLGTLTLADPAGSTGRSLSFTLPASVAANGSVDLSYFVRLGVGSQQGDGINRATGEFDGPGGTRVRSNTAAFKVTVQGGVFSNEGCIVGKVYTDCDGNHVQNNASGSREIGIPGVRLVMLDGSYVITDSEGKYSMCGLKSQTHVVKVDRTTLPKGARMLPSSNRNAGDGNSLFVDMKGGEMHRADFIEGSCSVDVLDQVKARRAQGGVLAPETENGGDQRIRPGGELPLQQILPAPRQNILTPSTSGRAVQ